MSIDVEVPPEFTLRFPAHQIRARVEAIGQELSVWAKKVAAAGRGDIVGVPILRGGIFFFADLVRVIEASVEIVPLRTVAYEVGEVGIAAHSVSVQGETGSLAGRSVLLVDEICESGRTLEKLQEVIRAAGAAEVRSVVIVKRELGHKTFSPDWVGFSYTGPEWLVGYGMDCRDRYRNLPAIYSLAGS